MIDFPLFRLTLAETRQRIWWLVPPLLIIALCCVSQAIVPSDLRLAWSGTTITQFAWGGAWLLGMPAMLIEAARLGAAHRQRCGHLFWRGIGLRPGSHLLSLTLPVLVLGSLSALLAALLSFFFGYHSLMAAGPWFLLHFQTFLFFMTVGLGLVALTLGMAVEISSAGALALSFFIFFAGQWLAVGIDEMRIRSEGDFRFALQMISLCIPQYRFADLTERIVYQWGALSLSSFFILWGYFVFWSLVLVLVVWKNFVPRRFPKKSFSVAAGATVLAVAALGGLLLFQPTRQIAAWRGQKIALGLNPLAIQRSGLGEIVTDVLIRQVDIAWHGGGRPWQKIISPSLCDVLSKHYRKLTTHPFAPTQVELFHNRQRSEAIVRLAFYLSPSNMQAYQAYFHLLSYPSLTGEMIPPRGAHLDSPSIGQAAASVPVPTAGPDMEKLQEISYLSLQSLDLTAPQQCLAAAWIWFNLFNITPKANHPVRQKMARQMLDSLNKADSAWNAGRPIPPGYDFRRERAFLGKLSTSVVKDAKE